MRNPPARLVAMLFCCSIGSLCGLPQAVAQALPASAGQRRQNDEKGPEMRRSAAGDRFRSRFGNSAVGANSSLGRIVRLLEGIDEDFQSMEQNEIGRELNDPFARL